MEGTQTAVLAAVTEASQDTTGLMLKLLVPALGVFAVSWGVRKGLKFFRTSANG